MYIYIRVYFQITRIRETNIVFMKLKYVNQKFYRKC